MKLSGCLAVVVTVLPAVIASAQVPVGHFSPPTTFDTLSARSKKIAHCVLDRARKSSQGIVEARDEATAKRFRPGIETALRGCMSARDRSITLRAFDLRGDLADELLTEADGAALRVARTRRAIAPTRLQRADGDQNEAVVGCAVAADPVDASALIESGAATPAEIAAFRQLVPAIQACVPTDYSLHLKPFEVRRLVAIALYRYVADQSGGQS